MHAGFDAETDPTTDAAAALVLVATVLTPAAAQLKRFLIDANIVPRIFCEGCW